MLGSSLACVVFAWMLRAQPKRPPGTSKTLNEGFEKRRHRRFDMTTSGSQVALVDWDGSALKSDYRDLLNLSYGGMCVRSAERLEPGTVQQYLLNLKGLIENEDLVLVKARVEWSQPTDSGGFTHGASFIESSKGWLS